MSIILPPPPVVHMAGPTRDNGRASSLCNTATEHHTWTLVRAHITCDRCKHVLVIRDAQREDRERRRAMERFA